MRGSLVPLVAWRRDLWMPCVCATRLGSSWSGLVAVAPKLRPVGCNRDQSGRNSDQSGATVTSRAERRPVGWRCDRRRPRAAVV